MKIAAIVLFCAASAVAVPYGYGGARLLATEELLPLRSGYDAHHLVHEAPLLRSAPLLVHEAPLLRSAVHVPIVKYLRNDDNYGTYNMETETGDGISTRESGNLKNVGSPEGPVNVKEGSYSWTSPEGQHFTVSYVADEFGYRASGTHLPTPPPIPAEIAASLRGASVTIVVTMPVSFVLLQQAVTSELADINNFTTKIY